MKRRVCEECLYFDRGRCVIDPPQVVVLPATQSGNNPVETRWPNPHKYDSCGRGIWVDTNARHRFEDLPRFNP